MIRSIVFRPDITKMVDWALKTNYLPTYPASIVRFQNLLYHVASLIDYVVGIGLYMIPSNLNLDITHTKDYNNAIVIAQFGHH